MRIAASWISDARLRTEQPAAAQRSDGVQRRAVDRRRRAIERLERHGGFGERFRGGDVEAVVGEPVGDGLLAFGLLDRRPHARARGVARHDVAHGVDRGELRVGQPRRAERARRPLRRPRGGPRAAPRCARSPTPGCSARAPVPPTASRARPSSRRAGPLEVKARARSTIVCTRIDVRSPHSRIMSGR